MKHTSLATALVLLGTSAFGTANADSIIYQSATDSWAGLSDVVSSSKTVTAIFTLDQATSIDAIGAQFVHAASGNIFGLITELAPGSTTMSLTPAQIETAGNYVAGTEVTFGVLDALKAAPTYSYGKSSTDKLVDYEADFASSVVLQAGTYAVVLGSGAFGATGSANIGLNNTATSGAQVFVSNSGINGGAWSTESGAELAVYGTPLPTPLPAAAWLLLSGMGGLGALGCRSKGGKQAA